MRQQCHQLGHIHRAAAAEADDQIDPGRPGLRHRRQDDVLGRVGNDLIVNRDLQPFRLEARQDFVERAETGDAGSVTTSTERAPRSLQRLASRRDEPGSQIN